MIIDENRKDNYILVESSEMDSYEGFSVEFVTVHFRLKRDKDKVVYPSQIHVKFEKSEEAIEKRDVINDKYAVPQVIRKKLDEKGYKIESF